MTEPSKFLVTEAAMRPASQARQCFYCHQPIGGAHKVDCVLINQRYRVRLTVEYEIDRPASWDKSLLEFALNGSSWCASNLVDELAEYVERLEKDGLCLCADAEFEFVRREGEPFLDE